MHSREQTIFALSSGRPPTAIAIVRVSGPRAGRVFEMLAGKMPRARHATYVLLRDSNSEPIDDAVVLWFPSPASATGEDVAEFHVHGSRAVIAALFEAFGTIENVRAAEPGEFTRRAFENGKLDLTAAEGLDDLIHADTDRQRRQALRQLNGLLGDKAESWRQQIIEASALIEAGIDFSDEGDVPADELLAPALAKIDRLRMEIQETLAAQGKSERLRDGLTIAIAGPPNAGKSTLLNRLARRDAAIVSPHAGTTRDVIEVHLDLNGYPVTLLDTAGVRDTDDPVEQEGVRRARERTRGADLVLWMIDASVDDAVNVIDGTPHDAPVWWLRNKLDLATRRDAADHDGKMSPDGGMSFEVSAARGDGVDRLLDALAAYAHDFFGAGEAALITRARHRTLLEQAASSLMRAGSMAGSGDEIIAEELRIAVQRLGELTGRIDVEQVLGAIFSKFCVGK